MKMLTGICLRSAALKTPKVRRFHLGVELVPLAGILWFVTSHWKNRIKTEAA